MNQMHYTTHMAENTEMMALTEIDWDLDKVGSVLMLTDLCASIKFQSFPMKFDSIRFNSIQSSAMRCISILKFDICIPFSLFRFFSVSFCLSFAFFMFSLLSLSSTQLKNHLTQINMWCTLYTFEHNKLCKINIMWACVWIAKTEEETFYQQCLETVSISTRYVSEHSIVDCWFCAFYFAFVSVSVWIFFCS